MPPPVFRFRPAHAEPASTLYVDGAEPGYRSFSHWPGNTTPAVLKRDLSTGIALAFADLDAASREELVGAFEVVANNHYDTDGVLSAFAVLHPQAALHHAPLLLAAAATGDFATWNGPEALAVELTVMRLTSAAGSPLASRLLPGTTDDQRHAFGYAWLLEHMPEILTRPFALEHLWADRHRRVLDDVRAVEAGEVAVERHPELDLAVVTSARPLTSIGLHHAAGDLFRVLLVHPGSDGPRYRFCYRDESWFELVTRRVPPRLPLDELVATLEREESAARGPAARAGARWWSTSLEQPVAELGFSAAGAPDGFFDDPALAADPPSALAPGLVVEHLRECLARGARASTS